MASKYQKKNEQKIDELIKQLIPPTTGFKQGQENFQIASKFATSNIKYHSFPDPDKISVRRKLDGLYHKVSILCKPELAEYLETQVQRFMAQPVSRDYPDMHYRMLDALIGLSGNIVEFNQDRKINDQKQDKKIQERQKQLNEDEREKQMILKEWGEFEPSSEDEKDDQIEVEESNQVLTLKKEKDIFEEEKPIYFKTNDNNMSENYLYHLSNPKKRSFSLFLEQTQIASDINQFKHYQPEYQNMSIHLQMTKEQDNFYMKNLIKVKEIDLVSSILYAFLQQETSIFKITKINPIDPNYLILCSKNQAIKELKDMNWGYFVLNQDICLTHLSVNGLYKEVKIFLDFVNLIFSLKTMTKYQLNKISEFNSIENNNQNSQQQGKNSQASKAFERESRVQEAFWYSIDIQLKKFDCQIDQIFQQLIYHTGKYDFKAIFNDTTLREEYFKAPVTLMRVRNQLKEQQYLYSEIFALAVKIRFVPNYKQKTIFSSPTINIIYKFCLHHILIGGKFLMFFLQFLTESLRPYILMIDNYLDFHNYAQQKECENEESIPIFLQNSFEQLQAIGNAFLIFRKIIDQNHTQIKPHQQLEKINFRQILMDRLNEIFKKDTTEPQRIYVLPQLELSYLKFDPPIVDTRDNSGQKFQEEINYGPYEIYRNQESFISSNFSALKEIQIKEKSIILQTEDSLLQLVKQLDIYQQKNFLTVLTHIFTEIIQEAHDKIQGKLLSIIFENLEFLDVLKFLRVLYFFERMDIMNLIVGKLAEGSATQVRLKGLQQQLKELLQENKVASMNLINQFEFQVEFNPYSAQQEKVKMMNPRNFQIKFDLSHPLDLIIDDNTTLLYNKIMQELIYFKNAKQNLISSHYMLKKRLYLVQNKRKTIRLNKDEDSDEDIETQSKYSMIDEKELQLRRAQLQKTYQLWVKLCHFGQEMINFVYSYEYFLFESIIHFQTKEFLDSVRQQKDFKSIIQLHISYLKSIADKMFLNKKSHQILETVNQLLASAQNFPLLVSRVSSLEIVDSLTIRTETERAEAECDQIKENYRKSLYTLIILFDKSERKAYAPEIIEAVFKSNYNKYYQQNLNF